VAVQDTPARSDAVNLSPRELLIYQAGQSFGAAQALRQVAEQVNKLSQTIAAQANQQAEHGNRLLDQALAMAPKTSGGQPGPALGRRVLKAVGALVGADD